ncbi:MAG TPA: DsbA family protein [Bdellovibrionota bacterium]|nr:DsbA family protein [Bdellovibrionota bacterium]
MKKNLPYVIGTALVAILIFVGASMLYKNKAASDVAATGVARADAAKLVKDDSATLGPVMSRLVLVEFLDPECESCRAMHPFVKNILKDYEGKIRYVVRYMPFHQNSKLAATWLEAAAEQGKYWEALDALFLQQPHWAAHGAPRPELIPQILKSVGVDVALAAQAKDKPEHAQKVERDRQDGLDVGVTGTPSFFVNGRLLPQLGDAPLRALIEEELRSSSN